jgi:hypothetical protein
MDEEKITAGLLTRLMADISEERWCAGWLGGLDYILWDAVVGRQKANITQRLNVVDRLQQLSQIVRNVLWPIAAVKVSDGKESPKTIRSQSLAQMLSD